MSKAKNWVVVSDLVKTRVFQVEKNKNLILKYTLKNDVEERDVELKQKGSVAISSNSSLRAMTNENSVHRKMVDPYVHDVCESLNKARIEHQFDQLMIVAGPEMLGQLRSNLDKNVQEVIREEVNKDYARFSMADIELSLQDQLQLCFE